MPSSTGGTQYDNTNKSSGHQDPSVQTACPSQKAACSTTHKAKQAAARPDKPAHTASHAGSGPRRTLTGGGVRIKTQGPVAGSGRASSGLARVQAARLNTSVPLVPPKPKLFFTATSIFMSRAVFAQ